MKEADAGLCPIHRTEETMLRDPGMTDGVVVEIEAAPVAVPCARGFTLMQLTSTTCRWSTGDPKTAGFFFCGATAMPGRPYCRGHCAVAYKAAGVAASAGEAVGPEHTGILLDREHDE